MSIQRRLKKGSPETRTETEISGTVPGLRWPGILRDVRHREASQDVHRHDQISDPSRHLDRPHKPENHSRTAHDPVGRLTTA